MRLVFFLFFIFSLWRWEECLWLVFPGSVQILARPKHAEPLSLVDIGHVQGGYSWRSVDLEMSKLGASCSTKFDCLNVPLSLLLEKNILKVSTFHSLIVREHLVIIVVNEGSQAMEFREQYRLHVGHRMDGLIDKGLLLLIPCTVCPLSTTVPQPKPLQPSEVTRWLTWTRVCTEP